MVLSVSFEEKHSFTCVEGHRWLVTGGMLTESNILPTFDQFFIHGCPLPACASKDKSIPLFEAGKPALQFFGDSMFILNAKFLARAHCSGPLNGS